jgi:UrcA family protein
MASIARLPLTVWLSILAVGLAPGCAASAPPDALSGGSAHDAPAARAVSQGSVPREASSIRVSYHDLDLATPEGIAALYVRIRRAATQVCDANRPGTGTRVISPEADACVRRSVVATVRQIGVPGLAALDAEQRVLSEEAPRPMCDAPVRARIII